MNDKKILEKAIKKAIENGYPDDQPDTLLDEILTPHDGMNVNDLIFSHDFAKALWGEKQSSHAGQFADGSTGYRWLPDWIHHLQMMVISDDPIKYLGENL